MRLKCGGGYGADDVVITRQDSLIGYDMVDAQVETWTRNGLE